MEKSGRSVRTVDARQSLLILIKTSRPPLWIALPLVFCMGLAYGREGLTDPSFQFTPLLLAQMFFLSFPFCFFTFGLNDIYDEASDRANPRKGGIGGVRLEPAYHGLVKKTARAVGVLFLCVSAATLNPLNILFSTALLVLAYTYSAPPWRLKTRPPLDVASAGILGFLAPFALGFSFVDDALALPGQAYYFTLCVMGFHAFSTIMDHDVDKAAGDRTFAVACGKRAAALFPAAIFLCGIFMVREWYVAMLFAGCLALSLLVAAFPSEKMAKHSFHAMFLGAVAAVAAWIALQVFR
ncbi:MAG: UbiA family prenyltransferase [Syntrophales bacterium]|jgi:4-hydroxybenzoate polyprenyltransferase|nr:UbiA family prenyltransferase [Syntrophales bacterium]MCK9528802.1 UbiA family prenyltransferase [Syntrophales bacterium]MDX9922749.1 UbiA family prenyltransferase [Syntrophales bacterium]